MLFKTTEKLLEYAELVNINFPSIKPTLRRVEEDHIVPVLGNELYASLDSAYGLITDEASLSPANLLLLDKCRCIIGPMACYYYAPKADIKLSDGGARREETNTSKTAYQYQTTNFREANLAEGEAATESLLRFLEDNKNSYPQWVNSAAFAEYRSLFIKTARDFDFNFKTATPYRNFYAMRFKMLDVEENTIRPALGDLLFVYLKLKDSTGVTMSGKENELIVKLKKTIAYYTVAFAIPFIKTRIDANGLTVVSMRPGGSNDESNSRSAAQDAGISNLMKSAEESGKTWLKNAITHLNTYPADFPLWPVPVVNTDLQDETTLRNGVFGMC